MLIGILSAACSLAQAAGYYADLLPDTLQPGNTYAPRSPYPALAKTAAGIPGRWPDTVDLKRGTTVMRMIGQVRPEGGTTYPLQVPANAVIGSYGAYSPKGVLLEADVALVPDIRKVVPILIVAPGQRGVRGGTYRFSATSNGLAFGPLPASGAYATDRYLRRFGNGDRYPAFAKSRFGHALRHGRIDHRSVDRGRRQIPLGDWAGGWFSFDRRECL